LITLDVICVVAGMQIVFKKDDAAEEQEATARPAKKAAAAPKASKAGSGQKRAKQQQEDADDADEDDFDVPRRKQQAKKVSQPASKVCRPVLGEHSCGGAPPQPACQQEQLKCINATYVC
jgi:hypothetical protein